MCKVLPQEWLAPVFQGRVSWASNASEKHFENHKLLGCPMRWGASDSTNGHVRGQTLHLYLLRGIFQSNFFGCSFSPQIFRAGLFPAACSSKANEVSECQYPLLVSHQMFSVSMWYTERLVAHKYKAVGIHVRPPTCLARCAKNPGHGSENCRVFWPGASLSLLTTRSAAGEQTGEGTLALCFPLTLLSQTAQMSGQKVRTARAPKTQSSII